MMQPIDYDRAEAEAIAKLPPEIVAAFKPVAFNALAPQWSKRIKSLDQLWPWVDAMQEGTARIWRNLGGLTGNELAAIETVAKIATERSHLIGCRRRPRDALLQAVIPWRYVRTLMPMKARVMELGPGSGYLGALLVMDGYDYCGIEITQPFWLWQRAFWGHWNLQPNAPWWHYARDLGKGADLIVACHMLNEMSTAALKMLIAQADCPILVEGWGSQGVRRREDSMAMFAAYGWSRANLARGADDAMNHRVDLLLPPGEARTVDLAAALKVLG